MIVPDTSELMVIGIKNHGTYDWYARDYVTITRLQKRVKQLEEFIESHGLKVPKEPSSKDYNYRDGFEGE